MIDDPALQHARRLILAHGRNTTAYQLLNPGMRLWFGDGGNAVVGYVERRGVRVVAGAPVCAPERLEAVAAEFEAAEGGRDVCYFCAELPLARLAERSPSHSRLLIGAQPAWNPEDWPLMLRAHASLRAQLNRARNKGVRVTEWPAERAHQHPALRRCLHQWLQGRGLPPLHFLVEPDTLGRLWDRRVLVAEREDEVVGFVVASPVPRRDGWLLEQVIRGRNAPNGTAELMIDAAVQAVWRDGAEHVSLGLSPLSTRAGLLAQGGPLWTRALLHWVRAHVHRFYNFQGLEAFKAKFRPAVWEPVFAVSSRPVFPARALYAVAAAFSDRSVASTAGRALWGAARQEARWLRARLRR